MMIVEAQVTIDGSKEAIWAKITDIENASKTISSFQKVEILEKPVNGLVGLKWRETGTIFGETATEIMWITEAAENEYCKARAESYGSIHINTTSITEQSGGCLLTMTLDSKPQSFMAKVLMPLLGFVLKGAMKKAILKDLNDIKAAVEQHGGGRAA